MRKSIPLSLKLVLKFAKTSKQNKHLKVSTSNLKYLVDSPCKPPLKGIAWLISVKRTTGYQSNLTIFLETCTTSLTSRESIYYGILVPLYTNPATEQLTGFLCLPK